jgi:hypothetical protein
VREQFSGGSEGDGGWSEGPGEEVGVGLQGSFDALLLLPAPLALLLLPPSGPPPFFPSFLVSSRPSFFLVPLAFFWGGVVD